MPSLDDDVSFAHAPFTVKLSAFDVRWPVFYSRRILVFGTSASKDVIIENMKKGVTMLVARCPALGGAMTGRNFTGPNGQKGWRRLGPGDGIRLVIKDLSDMLDFKTLEADNFPPHRLTEELLLPVRRDFNADTHQVLVLQLSLIDGGALISFCISHGLTDGTGMTTITNMLAECCQAAQDPCVANAAFPVTDIDNSVLVGAGGTKTSWNDHPACRPVDPPLRLGRGEVQTRDGNVSQPVRIYRISEARLEALKAAATADRISTNDALFALIWRLIMGVRLQTGVIPNNPDMELHLVVATGTRRHLGLDDSHIGNLAYLTTSKTTVNSLIGPNGLIEAAAEIRKAINAVDKNTILSLARLIEDMPEVSIPESALFARNQDVVITPISFYHAGEALLRADWGELLGHRALRLRCGHRGFWSGPGGQFILPRMPDGQGCEIQFQLPERGLELLESDPLFREYLEV